MPAPPAVSIRPPPTSGRTQPPMTQVILGQVLNGIIVGTLYGIIALGVTLTFGITGIVNFALGQFMMIGAYAAWHLTDVAHLPYPSLSHWRCSSPALPAFCQIGRCFSSRATISSTACSCPSA